MNDIYDIIIIGTGPGGYNAAIRTAQYGAKVAIVEKNKIGGTCLNIGCIPTKALHASAKFLEEIQKKAEEFGIQTDKVSFNFKQAIERKNKIVKKLAQGIESLLKMWKVEIYYGFGSLNGGEFESGYEVLIKNGDSNTIIKGKAIIIATGAKPAMISDFNIDHNRILTSDDILSSNFKTIPKRLLIIGGGIIGCEFASIFNKFGSLVTILEYLPSILSTEESIIVKELKSKFKEKGIEIYENQNVISIENLGFCVRAITCSANVPKDQIESTEKSYFDADYCLISVGREKNSVNLGLEKLGVEIEKGAINVDLKTLETSARGIYAIGDVIPGIMLAHVASYQGKVAVANALSSIGGFKINPKKANYSIVPYTIFTIPEIGSVGMRKKSIRKKDIPLNMGKFAYAALGKAKCIGEEEGFMLVLANKNTDEILGASCIGAEAPELIAIITLAMQNGLTCHEITETIYSHPTISEMVLECVDDIYGIAIHKKGHPKLKDVFEKTKAQDVIIVEEIKI